ncbi:hypothetical protein MUO66_06890, partial [Candidatus Bathyarchaeota archaeon]|nr:hypothetical protein [Candidatus Bathyarchaeota archaeon]
GEWISKYKVEDLSSGQLMQEVDFANNVNIKYGSIFAGAEVNVTFTVELATTASFAKLNLRTNLQHSKLQQLYWELQSQDYVLLDYNPNSLKVEFNQVRGTLVMSLYGKIPITIASTIPVDYIFVTLYGPSGETLDTIEESVVTAAQDEFQSLLEIKQEKLQSLKDSGVAAGYVELYENVLDQAEDIADQGYVTSAINLLNSLSVSSEPVSGIMEALFLPIAGVLGVLAAIFAFLFFKGRGQISYLLLVVEDQIKDLEGLTLRISKIDRSIGTRLEGVRDRLKSLVGM